MSEKNKTKLLREKDRLMKRLGAPILDPGEDDEIVDRLEQIAAQLVEIAQAHQARPPAALTNR